MRTELNLDAAEATIFLTTDIVYSSRVEFCGCQYVPLKLSIMRPRYHFACDTCRRWPTIVFLCGGGWTETDRNAWLPELTYFAKRGYAVASVQYPVSAATRFPDQIVSIKEAVRFLRVNAGELRLDMEHTALFGESAGAYLALLSASTPGQYGSPRYGGVSDSVDAVVALYPPVSPGYLIEDEGGCSLELPRDAMEYPSLLDTIGADMVPAMLLHGSADTLVPLSNGEKIYQHMQSLGIAGELYVLNGADHSDVKFFQDDVKALIIEFLVRTIGMGC